MARYGQDLQFEVYEFVGYGLGTGNLPVKVKTEAVKKGFPRQFVEEVIADHHAFERIMAEKDDEFGQPKTCDRCKQEKGYWDVMVNSGEYGQRDEVICYDCLTPAELETLNDNEFEGPECTCDEEEDSFYQDHGCCFSCYFF